MRTLKALCGGVVVGVATNAAFAAIYRTTPEPSLVAALSVAGAIVCLMFGGDK